jgi:hypothetical protein
MEYGVIFLRSSGCHAKRVKIAQRVIKLSIPAQEERVMDYEFKSIFYDDCYGLRNIDGRVESILDIGSNIGLFSLAARSRFPSARIHGYEPNPAIQHHLLSNTDGLSIDVHAEAVGACEGWIELKTGGGSLLSVGVASGTGSIKKTAVANAVERI